MARTAQRAAASPIVARLLGETAISIGERALTDGDWPRRAARTVLMLLLATPGHSVPRDQLLETLWPEWTPDSANNALYRALHSLRRVLEPELETGRDSSYIETTSQTIRIKPEPGCRVDLVRVEASLGLARSDPDRRRAHLRDAADLYAGDLLASEPYLDWPIARRESLRQRWTRALLDLVELDLAAGEPLASVDHLERLLGGDPTEEDAHRLLIRAHLAAGQNDRAKRQYDRCARVLRDELGVAPDPATESLRRQFTELEPPFISRRVYRPPAPPTPLIGRDRELAAIQDLLWDNQVRLVTLTGAGGIGKSHLALAAASSLAGDFVHGAAFVPLAALRDPNLIVPAICRVFGIGDDTTVSAFDRLVAVVHDLDLLLVLDNLEQIIDAASTLADLLAAAPDLKILATSRERLRLRGEHEIAVPPLATLDPGRNPARTSIEANDAVRLFVRRVRAGKPAFTVTDANALDIAAICRRLDGIPLAIELAAAATKHLSIAALVGRLERPLDLLNRGARDAPARHQTLRDAIAWSYDLLSDDERSLFRHLSVFAGSFDSAAAAAVRNRPGIDDLLESLVERNLLKQIDDDDIARWSMLGTLRDAAEEYLVARDESESARQRHAAWYADLVASANNLLEGPEQSPAFVRLEPEFDNLRIALTWAIANRPEIALRLIGSAWRLWEFTGLLREGHDWLERTLDATSGSDPDLRLPAILGAAVLAHARSDYVRARQRIDGIVQSAGQSAIGRARAIEGAMAISGGDSRRAIRFLTEAVSACSAARDRWGSASARIDLALAYYYAGEEQLAGIEARQAVAEAELLGDPRLLTRVLVQSSQLKTWDNHLIEAIALLTDALATSRTAGDRDGLARAHLRLGEARGHEGNVDAARTEFDAALTGYRDLGKVIGVATAHFYRGRFAAGSDIEGARADLIESLRLFHSLNSIYVLDSLQGIAGLALDANQPRLGAFLLGFVVDQREKTGQPLRVKWYQDDLAVKIDAANARLSAEDFDCHWSQGRGSTFGVVIEAASLPRPFDAIDLKES